MRIILILQGSEISTYLACFAFCGRHFEVLACVQQSLALPSKREGRLYTG